MTPGEKLRLVGVGVSGFEGEPIQTSLFGGLDDEEVLSKASIKTDNLSDSEKSLKSSDTHKTRGIKHSALISHAKKNSKLLEANDMIAQHFGEQALRFVHELRSYADTTGSSAKNPEDYKD